MKKHLPTPPPRLPFGKERVTLLAPADLDHIIGGFQLEPHECQPASLALDGLCPQLAGHLPLAGYGPAQPR